MPLTHFICPSGDKVAIADCLKSCPDRCMSLPTLQAIGGDKRIWNGKASTTQLLNGTRYSYLEITKDYAVSPDEYAFALIGTRHHKILDEVAKKLGMISEKKLEGTEVSGILDLLVPDNNGGFELWDIKTSGSYKIANALGLTKEPVHIKDWELQLNNYRLMLEGLDFKITKMFIQATARDGGLASSKRLGITRKINKIEIQRLDDDYVACYFASKNKALLNALQSGTLPPMCDYDERWANNKCLGYCPVVEFCPEGLKMKGEK
jgi:hypothetical protein